MSPPKMDLMECILTRKSVRHFDITRPVPKSTLLYLVQAGCAAPTGCNAQPWHFVIVTNRVVLDKVADTLESIQRPLVKFVREDCACATQNILLAAHAHGLGAVWTTTYPGDRSDRVRNLLSLPATLVPMCVVPIGYASEG
ncbi:hypothetical protein KIPB_002303 [Kipferlia bialata]|uniref:Nitroreductase domain-containing protein n=1 Tax=Kipferlia bialata TaxID=797122 RepID=A0A9K3CLN4_9EUKA|nr:hypothetical protein KIPB_000038 [Kipferlia bialata]GIQ81356.1 hypothetical protein KIPB_002303 [Kipferlia bialata]|eukprot:g38.t1